MNGAEALLRTLMHCGVDICFTNPGTSEMHFISAVDRVQGMRCVLALFEGVAAGAADGYARMADRPASTLFHLGPGLGNAMANLHNARRARAPIVNVVGDHATYHRKYDAPLTSDVAAFAKPVSNWVRDAGTPDGMAAGAREAVLAAMSAPRGVATLIAPADCSWQETSGPIIEPLVPGTVPTADDGAITAAARILRSGEPAGLLLNGQALTEAGVELAGRIAAHTGARVFCDTFAARQPRGAGRPVITRLPYFPERVLETLNGLRHLVLVETRTPVAFFAYPGKQSELLPPGCSGLVLARPDQDGPDALAKLADELGARDSEPVRQERIVVDRPVGALNPETLARATAALLPENAIVVDEGLTAAMHLGMFTAGAPAHDWLTISGGAIGGGMPVAAGAALACSDRKVLSMQADGSGMYTLQSLWTQARESLDVTTVILSNRAYNILNIEHHRMGQGDPGPKAHDLMSLDRPDLDWVKLAAGMGVPAARVTTAEQFASQLEAFLREPGPNLIEAMVRD